MEWDEAMSEARSELGYGEGEYIKDFQEVVDLAKDIREDWREENPEEYEEQKKDNKEDYQEYLKSDRWKKLRKEILIKNNFKCEDCKGIANEVHHKRYVNIETPWEKYELVALCGPCHGKRHHKNRGNQNGK